MFSCVSLPVRLCFPRVSRVPAFSMFSKVLAISTLACIIDSVFAFSLPVPLPQQPTTWITTLDCLLDSVIASSLPVPLPLQTATCVTTLDWINDDPRCPSLIGIVCLYLDCLTVYRTRSVKLVILHLCLRVEHLDPTFPRTLQRLCQTAYSARYFASCLSNKNLVASSAPNTAH